MPFVRSRVRPAADAGGITGAAKRNTQKVFGAGPKRTALGDIGNGHGQKQASKASAGAQSSVAAGPPKRQGSRKSVRLMKKRKSLNSSDFMDTADDTEVLPIGVVNVDENDVHDPQLVSEYVREIYSYMKQLERQQSVTAGYMEVVQTRVTSHMRSILVDWLVEVHIRFKLIPETLQLTVVLLDRYLQGTQITRDKLQLVGVTAMLIASKYEEMYPPEVRDFVWIADNAYSKQEILAMEGDILSKLGYNLGAPLPITFLRRYTKAAQASKLLEFIGVYLIELSLANYEMASHMPSIKAAAAMKMASQIVGVTGGAWTANLRHYTGYDEAEFEHSYSAMHKVLLASTDVSSKLQAVQKKWTDPKKCIGQQAIATLPEVKTFIERSSVEWA